MKTIETFSPSMQPRRNLTKFITSLLFAFAVMLSLSVTTFAQNMSAAQLKLACETSPGNTVALTDSSKIEGGSASVLTGCTITIPETKALELVRAQITFNGPLTIVGAVKTKVELVDQSLFSASSINLNFTAFESEVKVDKSRLAAGAGGVQIAMGDISKVQFAYASGAGNTVDSTGPITFSAGQKLTMEMNNVTFSGGGLTFNFNGADSKLIAENAIAGTKAAGQNLTFAGIGAKTLIEAKQSQFSAHGDLSIALSGSESTLKTGDSSRITAGGRVDVVVSNASGNGLIEMAQVRVEGNRVDVNASADSDKGKVIYKLGTAIAATDLTFRTGQLGTTEVAESSLTAGSTLRIATGPFGDCKQEKNVILAPIQMLCN